MRHAMKALNVVELTEPAAVHNLVQPHVSDTTPVNLTRIELTLSRCRYRLGVSFSQIKIWISQSYGLLTAPIHMSLW